MDPTAPRPDALEVISPAQAIVRPAVTRDEALSAWKEYLDLKAAIAKPEDIQVYYQNGEPRQFYKKAYWRKVATFFNLTVEWQEGTERFVRLPGTGLYAVTVKYRATAPNGRTVTGDGHCGLDEKGKEDWTYMQVAGVAHTRGYNRSVSNLVGGGEVSAEEMDHADMAAGGDPAPVPGPGQPPAKGFKPQSPIGFASCKGQYPRDIDESSLDWYIKVTREKLEDPQKQKYHRQNELFLRELLDEQEDRKMDGTFPTAPPQDAGGFGANPVEPHQSSVLPFSDYKGFIEGCGKLKVEIGVEAYYEVMREFNLAHVNQVSDMETAAKVWRVLSLKVDAQEISASTGGRNEPDDIPF